MPNDRANSKGFYLAAGYMPVGPLAARVDMLERFAALLRQKARENDGKVRPDPDLLSLLGCTVEQAEGVFTALGWRAEVTKVKKSTLEAKDTEKNAPAPAKAENADAAKDAVKADAAEPAANAEAPAEAEASVEAKAEEVAKEPEAAAEPVVAKAEAGAGAGEDAADVKPVETDADGVTGAEIRNFLVELGDLLRLDLCDQVHLMRLL